MPVALELAFGIHISAVAQTGVDQGRVQHVAFAVGQDNCLRENSDGRFARNAARFVDFGDPALHGGADRNHSLSIEHDIRRHHSSGEGIAFLAGESGQSIFQFDFERRARGQRHIGLCPSRGRQQQHAKHYHYFLHSAS